MKNTHAKEYTTILKELRTDDEKGLSTTEAMRRWKEYGANTIKEQPPIAPLKILFNQFASPLILILICAAIISAVLSEIIDAVIILAILVLNALLGFIQEYKAERALEALKKLSAPQCKVIRDGKLKEIKSVDIVPGDIIVVEIGDKISADARIIEATNLETQEAALTGESTPIPKDNKVLSEKTPTADQRNMLFSGTIVTRGRAKAGVTATGMETECGKIAKFIQQEEGGITPLKKKIAELGKMLGAATLLIAVTIFFMGIFRQQPLLKMVITALSLAVAAVPEGLPVVVTITLALGAKRMAMQKALMRKLASVETLGSVSVICTDKTGTLTRNEMTIKKIWVDRINIDVTGTGYEKDGKFVSDGTQCDLQHEKTLIQILKSGALCNNTKISDEENKRTVIGDPTEGALIVSAEKANLSIKELTVQYPRYGEIEFTSERKMMTTLHKAGKKRIAITKGAPDVILKHCTRMLVNGQVIRITKTVKQEIETASNEYAAQALRVLGFAIKEIYYTTREKEIEKEMIFIGLQAMIDPPRPETREALEQCQTAGIKVIMVTGDHKITAEAIARELGIGGTTLIGEQIEQMTSQELKKRMKEVGVCARVNPEHKIRIVEALKAENNIVAMTGDGVNDAPSLKKADIGIAIGEKATDAAKEASDMVITDGNFATIVNAVREGRTMFNNIKKFVMYMLSSNTGEIITIGAAMLLGLPLPLVAVQILWINLVTDGAPATALSAEPEETNIMKRPPRKKEEKIMGKRQIVWMACIGTLMAIGTIGVFAHALFTKSGAWSIAALGEASLPYRYATTMAFTTLVLFQMVNVLNCKTLNSSLFSKKQGKNMWLMAAILSSILLQIVVVQIPFMNNIFGTVPLNLVDWMITTAVASSVLIVAEAIKVKEGQAYKMAS